VSPVIENMDRMVRDIPAMPVVAQKVMHMLGDPRTTNITLGETLATDISMASRVLQMANSPFFGARQKISSVSQAIFILGHSALRSLIITICTKGLFKKPGLMEQKIWEHGVGAGMAARALAGKTGLMEKDDAFIGGLLHDVGRMILLVVYRNDYQSIFERAYNDTLTMEEVNVLERQEFGYDHSEIGARVVSKWRLPNVYARMARRHHADSADLLGLEENPKTIAVAAQANLIAHRLGFGLHEPDRRVEVVSTIYVEMLGLAKSDVLEVIETTLKDHKEFRDEFSL